MNGCIIEKLTEALTEALSVPVKDFNRIFLKCEGSIGALKKKKDIIVEMELNLK